MAASSSPPDCWEELDTKTEVEDDIKKDSLSESSPQAALCIIRTDFNEHTPYRPQVVPLINLWPHNNEIYSGKSYAGITMPSKSRIQRVRIPNNRRPSCHSKRGSKNTKRPNSGYSGKFHPRIRNNNMPYYIYIYMSMHTDRDFENELFNKLGVTGQCYSRNIKLV